MACGTALKHLRQRCLKMYMYLMPPSAVSTGWHRVPLMLTLDLQERNTEQNQAEAKKGGKVNGIELRGLGGRQIAGGYLSTRASAQSQRRPCWLPGFVCTTQPTTTIRITRPGAQATSTSCASSTPGCPIEKLTDPRKRMPPARVVSPNYGGNVKKTASPALPKFQE